MTRRDSTNPSMPTSRRAVPRVAALGRVAVAYAGLAMIASSGRAQPAHPTAATSTAATPATQTATTSTTATAPVATLPATTPIGHPARAAAASEPTGLAISVGPNTEQPAEQPASPGDDRRSPRKAWWLSLGGALIAGGVSAAALFTKSRLLAGFGGVGMTIAPSAGQYYAGAPGRATLAALVRGVGSAAVLYGLNQDASEDCSIHCEERATFLMLIGAGFALSATAWSIVDAPDSARRHNRHSRALTIVPAPIAGPGGSMGAGLHLGLRFH